MFELRFQIFSSCLFSLSLSLFFSSSAQPKESTRSPRARARPGPSSLESATDKLRPMDSNCETPPVLRASPCCLRLLLDLFALRQRIAARTTDGHWQSLSPNTLYTQQYSAWSLPHMLLDCTVLAKTVQCGKASGLPVPQQQSQVKAPWSLQRYPLVWSTGNCH